MKLEIRGSFVIAAICKDGIIVASDSRANIFDRTDQEQKVIAYYDTEQKIYPMGNCVLAQTGQGLIFNVFFSTIVHDFGRLYPISLVNELLPQFLNHCQQTLPIEAVEVIRKQKLFAAGFIGKHPTICYFNQCQEPIFGCIRNQGYIQSSPTLFGEIAPINLSARNAADRAEKAIQVYAQEGNRWMTIGGPVSVLLITRIGAKWIKNAPPIQQWKYIQEFVKNYRNGKIEVTLIPPSTRETLDELLSTVT